MNSRPLCKLFELAFIAVLVLALELSAPPAAYAQGVMVNNIQITGLVNLGQGVIIDALTIKPGAEITGNVLSELNKNAEALYNLGFFQTTPELSLDYLEGNTILLIKVLENPLFKDVVFKGNSIFSNEELRAFIKQQPGEVTNLKQMEQDISSGILGHYADEGYVGAYIQEFALSTLEEDAGTVYITISEGMIDDIVFEGNKKTKTSLLKMIVGRRLQVGQVLKKDAVEKSMQDLYNMGVVEPTMEPAPTGGNIVVKFKVTETTTGQAGIGMGYSTVNGLQGTLSYSERNLMGQGKTISAQIVFSKNNPGFQIDYSDPYLSKQNFFSASIYDLNYRQQRNPGTPAESELEVDSVGGDISFGHHVNDELSVNAGISLTDYDYTVKKGDPFKDYDPARRLRLMQTGQTRSLTLGAALDTRDNIFTTHEGAYVSGLAEIAGFGGDFDFRKYTAEGRVFIPNAEKNTLGLRAKVGIGDGNVPIFEEFELGGVNSVRGIQEDSLTGTKMLLLNGEYRFPLDKKSTFTGVIFLDWGLAGESFSEMDHSTSGGLGVRFRIPALGLGSIRLDLGWDLEDGGSRLNFGIGEMF
jgi:outer membrane protein insertion porin family